MRRLIVGVAVLLSISGCQLIAGLPSKNELCVTNADCPAETPSCKRGECISQACTPACSGKSCGPDGCGGDCGQCSNGKICEAGACVASCTKTPCAGSLVCDTNSGACKCDGNEDCAGSAGKKCDLDDGACVQCLSNDDCPSGMCVQQVCRPCSGNADCATLTNGEKPACKGSSGKCIECTTTELSRCTAVGKHACIAEKCATCSVNADCGADHACTPQNECIPGVCARTGDPACVSPNTVCNLAVSPTRCEKPVACDAGHPCANEWETCAKLAPHIGECLRCEKDADCAADAACTAGACIGKCEFDYDCSTNAAGKKCRGGGVCGCATNGDCAGATPVCGSSNQCAECKSSTDCAGRLDGKLRCHSSTCAQCDVDADCKTGKPLATCAGGVCACTKKTCSAGDCGAIDDGCGGTLTCNTCVGAQTCASNKCVDPVPVFGSPCGTDADCAAGGMSCVATPFVGSETVASPARMCAKKSGTCAGTEVLRDGVCLQKCLSDSTCPAQAFCATDRLDTSVRFCTPGCRIGGCGTQTCDRFLRKCVPTVASTPGVTACSPGNGGCSPTQVCVPKGAGTGVCANACTQTNSSPPACICIPGASNDGGACHSAPAGSPNPGSCVADGDCGYLSLCRRASGQATGVCDSICVLPGGSSVIGGEMCDTASPCASTDRGWKESTGFNTGICRLAVRKNGDACSSSSDCGQGETCRWSIAGLTGSGTCVTSYTTFTDCQNRCSTGDTCVADPDVIQSGPAICTRTCSNPAGCQPGLACNAGGCTRTCGADPDCRDVVLTGRTADYTCQKDVNVGNQFRCQEAPAVQQGEGGPCATTSECSPGLLCSSEPFAATGSNNPKKCRRACAPSTIRCTGGNACLAIDSTNGVCALIGNTLPDANCITSDDCQAGNICRIVEARTVCKPACLDPGDNPAGCSCAKLDASGGRITSACTGTVQPFASPPWCAPLTVSAAEQCNFCDENNNNIADENIGTMLTGTTPLALSLKNSGSVQGTVVGVATQRASMTIGGGGFITAVANYFTGPTTPNWEVSVLVHRADGSTQIGRGIAAGVVSGLSSFSAFPNARLQLTEPFTFNGKTTVALLVNLVEASELEVYLLQPELTGGWGTALSARAFQGRFLSNIRDGRIGLVAGQPVVVAKDVSSLTNEYLIGRVPLTGTTRAFTGLAFVAPPGTIEAVPVALPTGGDTAMILLPTLNRELWGVEIGVGGATFPPTPAPVYTASKIADVTGLGTYSGLSAVSFPAPTSRAVAVIAGTTTTTCLSFPSVSPPTGGLKTNVIPNTRWPLRVAAGKADKDFALLGYVDFPTGGVPETHLRGLSPIDCFFTQSPQRFGVPSNITPSILTVALDGEHAVMDAVFTDTAAQEQATQQVGCKQ